MSDSFIIFWLSSPDSFRMPHIGRFFGQIFTPAGIGTRYQRWKLTQHVPPSNVSDDRYLKICLSNVDSTLNLTLLSNERTEKRVGLYHMIKGSFGENGHPIPTIDVN